MTKKNLKHRKYEDKSKFENGLGTQKIEWWILFNFSISLSCSLVFSYFLIKTCTSENKTYTNTKHQLNHFIYGFKQKRREKSEKIRIFHNFCASLIF